MIGSSDYLLKLSRAHGHLNDLQENISQWLDGNHHMIRRHRYPDRPNCLSLRVTVQDIPADPFALLVGDILHNLRGCLDHLVYTLALKHTNPLPDDIAKGSEFPIFGDKNARGNLGAGLQMFRSNGLNKIRGIHPDAQAIIKNLQPYHRGKDFASDPLWVLHELSNIDKHRLLIVAHCHSDAMLMEVDRFRTEGNTIILAEPIHVYGGFIEGETEVLSCQAIPADPNREMNVEFFRPLLDIAFKCGSVVDGIGLTSVLGKIHSYILTNVIPPLSRFLGIVQVGAPIQSRDSCDYD